MMSNLTKLIDPTRDDLVHAIRHAMLFQGRRRTHHSDYATATAAAENVIDGLASANLVIVRAKSEKSRIETDENMEAAVRALEASFKITQTESE